jgi:hypothetical protein
MGVIGRLVEREVIEVASANVRAAVVGTETHAPVMATRTPGDEGEEGRDDGGEACGEEEEREPAIHEAP